MNHEEFIYHQDTKGCGWKGLHWEKTNRPDECSSGRKLF